MRISDWSSDVCSSDLGHYTIDAHLRHDPSASERFAETHVRRLEAMRRSTRIVEREPDGSWIITPDHLDKVEQFEAHQLPDRPVIVDTPPAAPLDTLPTDDGAPWLARAPAPPNPPPLPAA